jgi:hypothetical protein
VAKTPPPRPDPDKPGERPRRRGREHAVHEEINRRRLGGGAEPTSDAFQRALEQWQQLPGSIVRPPTDIKPEGPPPPSPPPPPDQDEGKPPPAGRGRSTP